MCICMHVVIMKSPCDRLSVFPKLNYLLSKEVILEFSSCNEQIFHLDPMCWSMLWSGSRGKKSWPKGRKKVLLTWGVSWSGAGGIGRKQFTRVWCHRELQCVGTQKQPGGCRGCREGAATGCEAWVWIWEAQTGVWDRRTLGAIGDKRSKLDFVAYRVFEKQKGMGRTVHDLVLEPCGHS